MKPRKRDDFLESIRGPKKISTPEVKQDSAVETKTESNLNALLKEKYKHDRQDQYCHTLSARIPLPLYRKLEEKAHKMRISVSTLVRELVENGANQLED